MSRKWLWLAIGVVVVGAFVAGVVMGLEGRYWYGAIVAMALLIVAILTYVGERVQIRVSAEQNYLVTPGVDTKEAILLKAVNIGKRPVPVVSGSLLLADGSQFLPTAPSYFGKPLPLKLEEGDVCTLWFCAEEVRKGERENKNKVVAVVFRDAAGREFKSKFHTRPTMAELEQSNV